MSSFENILVGRVKTSEELQVPVAPATSELKLKNIISEQDWNDLRRAVYVDAGYGCSVCGDIGNTWPVAAEALWSFHTESDKIEGYGVQELDRVVAMCPACLSARQTVYTYLKYGYADQKKVEAAVNRFSFLRHETVDEVFALVEKSVHASAKLEEFAWVIDISWIDKSTFLRGRKVSVVNRNVPMLYDGVVVGGV